MNKPIIPVFYACDDNYIKYTLVSMYSLKKNASPAYDYKVCIMHAGIDPDLQRKVTALSSDGFEISFCDVADYLATIADKLPVRDYFSKTTYYRFFIAEIFPEYDKAIYVDSDTIVCGDISELYATDISDFALAAAHDQVIAQIECYGQYSEKVLDIPRDCYFQAGVMLINCDKFRTGYVLDRFMQLLHTYDFRVAQDQDYLNVICKDHVRFLDQRWNTEIVGEIPYSIEEAKIIHYNMTNKPWLYKDCRYADVFWSYAEETCVYGEIVDALENYTDEQRAHDLAAGEALAALAWQEVAREDNYLNRLNNAARAKDRVEILKKIEEYEREGRFDEDVEADPPGRVLMPEDIDYLKRGMTKRLKTKFAFMMARRFVNNLIDEKKMIIKEIRGIENFRGLDSGAIITCNHFNAFDSFAIQLAYDAAKQPKRTFYRVIREGNYTSFPGFYGFLMRHCNTLPLSSNLKTLAKFNEAAGCLLKNGNFVLVYPEQSMWWNYRKPKPMKSGAFMIAAKNGVPVLPCFITMKDSDIMGDDGFYVQEYTIHISEPIYPDPQLTYRQQIKDMMDRNFLEWKRIYEREYGLPLSYITEDQSKLASLPM